MQALRRLLLVTLFACGAPNEPATKTTTSHLPPRALAPASSASAPLDASSPMPADASTVDAAVADASFVPRTFTSRPSGVIVTGGLGYASDRFARPSDAKPGDKVEVVRVICTARAGKPDEEYKYACSGAAKSTSPDAHVLEKRVRACFDVKDRAATPAEAAKVLTAMANSKDVEVPPGQIYLVELRYVRKEPERVGVPCRPSPGQPCDPVTVETGRMVDVTETTTRGIAPGNSDASSPYATWTMTYVDITPPPSSIEGESHVVRVAMLYDAAVDAVRSKDRARIASAVKALEDDVGTWEDRSLQPIAMQVSREMATLRAIVAGRATIGDACKK